MTAHQAAALGLPPIDLKTANDYIRMIVALFDWAKASFDDVKDNHFAGATFAIKTDQREEKDPFCRCRPRSRAGAASGRAAARG